MATAGARKAVTGDCMSRFIERHPAWALILLIAVAVMLWLILADLAARS